MTAAVVLVTGATSGIGRATALLYASQGATLVLAARSERTLDSTAVECRDAGAADVLTVPTDVRSDGATQALVAAAVEAHDRVDVCVHAAAVIAYGEFLDVPAEVFSRAVETNLLGTANVARAVLPVMRRQHGGCLVVVGSVLGKMTAPYLSAYSTGKWGVRGLARSLSQEMRGTGVRVVTVSPGGVNTPVYLQAGSYTGRTGRPPPPVDPPEKVAAAVVRAAGRRRGDVSVGLANPLMVLGFTALPAVFDALVGPLMRRIAVSGQAVEPNPGNIFEPRPAGEAVHGPWSRWGLLGLRERGGRRGR